MTDPTHLEELAFVGSDHDRTLQVSTCPPCDAEGRTRRADQLDHHRPRRPPPAGFAPPRLDPNHSATPPLRRAP